MAVVTPMGMTRIIQIMVSRTVPRMTGKIPPWVMDSMGDWVINPQLKTGKPLIDDKKRDDDQNDGARETKGSNKRKEKILLHVEFFLVNQLEGLDDSLLDWASNLFSYFDGPVSLRDEVGYQAQDQCDDEENGSDAEKGMIVKAAVGCFCHLSGNGRGHGPDRIENPMGDDRRSSGHHQDDHRFPDDRPDPEDDGYAQP